MEKEFELFKESLSKLTILDSLHLLIQEANLTKVIKSEKILRTTYTFKCRTEIRKNLKRLGF